MDEVLKQIGKRLYEQRQRLHMTQDELAEMANITPQTVSTAELGKKAMRADTIIRVCKALNISANYLLLGDVSPMDTSILSGKTGQLTTAQYRHLEDIIDSYVAAVSEPE